MPKFLAMASEPISVAAQILAFGDFLRGQRRTAIGKQLSPACGAAVTLNPELGPRSLQSRRQDKLVDDANRDRGAGDTIDPLDVIACALARRTRRRNADRLLQTEFVLRVLVDELCQLGFGSPVLEDRLVVGDHPYPDEVAGRRDRDQHIRRRAGIASDRGEIDELEHVADEVVGRGNVLAKQRPDRVLGFLLADIEGIFEVGAQGGLIEVACTRLINAEGEQQAGKDQA